MPATHIDAAVDQYAHYNVVNSYERVEGTLVLPTVDGAPVVIQTHEPYNVRRVTYNAAARGRPPVLPRPADDATLLTHAHSMPIPTPIASAEGGGWVYSAVGDYTVLETAAATLAEQTREYPRWPARLEPMATEMEQRGYTYYLDDTPAFTPSAPSVESDSYRWPSALTVSPEWFSDRLA